MSLTFHLKTLHHVPWLDQTDVAHIMEQTEESFMAWLSTCMGGFAFSCTLVDFEYDFRTTVQDLFITYDEPCDAVAHRLRWSVPVTF